MGRHQGWRAAVIIGTFVVYLATLAVSIYYSFAGNMFTDATSDDFEEDFENGNFALETKILPASWVFAVVWSGIYLYNFLWMCYALSLLLRKSTRDTYLYYDPPFIPITTFLCFSVTSILGALWLYVSDLGLIWENTVVIAVMLVFVQLTFFTAVFGLNNKTKRYLRGLGKGREIGWTIALTHNALGMYMTWITIATFESVALTMVYVVRVDGDITCYVILAILAVVLVVWVSLDNFLIYERTKYVFTPYVVFILAFLGITIRNNSEGRIFDPVNIFVLVHLSLGSLALVLKAIVLCLRMSRGSSGSATPEKKLTSILKKPKSEKMAEMNLGYEASPAPIAAPIAAPIVSNGVYPDLTTAMNTPAPAYSQVHAQPQQQQVVMAAQPQQLTLGACSSVVPQAAAVQPCMVAQQPVVIAQQQPVVMAAPQVVPSVVYQASQVVAPQVVSPRVVVRSQQAPVLLEQTSDGCLQPLPRIRRQIYMPNRNYYV